MMTVRNCRYSSCYELVPAHFQSVVQYHSSVFCKILRHGHHVRRFTCAGLCGEYIQLISESPVEGNIEGQSSCAEPCRVVLAVFSESVAVGSDWRNALYERSCCLSVLDHKVSPFLRSSFQSLCVGMITFNCGFLWRHSCPAGSLSTASIIVLLPAFRTILSIAA